QEISAAQDMEAVTEAYNKAIKAMKNAPTKELEELYNAKEAYKTTALANYVAYKYTQNKSGYDTAYNKVVAEIDAYSGEISGLAADAKIVAALKALGEVKNDETVVTEAKAAAIAALEAYRADETFESKATEYATALNAAKGLVNAVTVASTAETTKADVDAKLAEITKAETDGKAEIDEVQSDSQLLAKAKEDAIAEISTYGDDKLSAITPGGSVTQDDIDEAKANIATTRNLRTNAIKSATSIEKVQEEVDLAKTNIDSYIAALTETLAQTKERELNTLKEEYDKIIADITDEVVLSILLEDYNGFVGRINGVTGEENKERVTEIRAEGVNLMRVRVARRTSYNTIVAHAAEVKADLFSKAACAAIDEEIKYDINTLTDQSKWSAHMWTIHNASTIVGVDNARDVVIAEIDKIAAAAKAASYEVKISADGLNQDVLIGKIVYGGTLDAVDVNLLPDDKTIDGGKLYTNEACTEEYDFSTKIYDATVLYAKLANATKGERTETFSYADIPVGDKVKDTPLTAADITGKNSFLTLGSGEVRYRLSSEKDDNKNFVQLTGEAFKVTFNGTGTLALSGRGTGSSANAAFAVVDEDGVACELVSVPSGVTEYDNNVYSIAASGHVKITFKVTKPGTYSIVVLRNGETDPITKNGVKSTATFGMGRISAIELNDSYKLQHDVSVVWGT
ncbi:MAG: hypothetical protein K2N50_01045, partial [Clostridia bacterium]|nr:hypothetical protein [Clostridia bacterium]